MRSRLVVIALLLLPLAASRINADPAPGLILTFESPDGAQQDTREARLVAVSIPHGTAASAFFTGAPRRITFHGLLNLNIRDQYTFRFSGRGECELLINGQSALESSGEDLSAKTSGPVKLKKGANEIDVRYTPPADGDALLRLSWAERNKPFNPVPPAVFTHEAENALTAQTQLRQGRELVATRRCLRCHAPDDALESGESSMPELSSDAPNLDDAGARLNAAWIAQWIADPKSVRPAATMPRLLAPAQSADARDIAAYLAARGAATDELKLEQSEPSISAGTRIFLSLGCIACHTAPAAQDDPERISLRLAGTKFKPAALLQYLKKPESHYAWTRMPNFSLSDEEANKLAAFLIATPPQNAFEAPDMKGADATRGKTLFESIGCMKCHEPKASSAPRGKALAELRQGQFAGGCLSTDPPAGAADFGFTDLQRASIQAFAKTDWSSLSRDSRAEFAERQVHALRCTACHTRDTIEDSWSKLAPQIASMEHNLPAEAPAQVEQSRPLLTWVGEKLQTDWMANFIAGKVTYKPRPWLKARMPAFASRAAMIAQGLTLQHGLPFNDPPEAPADADMAAIGKQLAGRNGGFSCNQCHAINQSPAFVPFDSPSPNFMYVHERLRKDFYHRWVRNPQKYLPNTRMPTYSDADGKTAYKTILEGDAHQQFEAIWQYLRAGRDIAPPE